MTRQMASTMTSILHMAELKLLDSDDFVTTSLDAPVIIKTEYYET